MAALEITETSAVDAATLTVVAGVRYWEDATVNGVEDDDGLLIPFRSGNNWTPTIDLDTGKIVGWPVGTVASIHYKVCDDGTYTLLGRDGDRLASIEGYVPAILSPGGQGYGDYIIMSVAGDGQIADWQADLAAFEEASI